MIHKKECECFFCRNPKIPKKIDTILNIVNKESLEERKVIARNFVRGIISTIELGEGEEGVVNRVGILNLINYDIINEHKAMTLVKNIVDLEKVEEETSYIA